MKKNLTRTLVSIFVLGSFLMTSCKDPAVDPATQVKSHTFSVSTWYWDTPDYYVNLNVPEITSDNLSSVGVLVYYSTQNDVWTSIPYTVYGTVHDYHMGFRYTPGIVEVDWMYDGTTSGDDPNTYYGTTVKCKVVTVPSSARTANPNIDWNNYEEVRQKFNLKD